MRKLQKLRERNTFTYSSSPIHENHWSDEAIADYHQNIDYLLKEWSEQVAVEFIEDVEAVIELIKSHPEFYALTDYQEVRKAVARK